MYKNSEEAFQTRASFARRWLSERNEDCIIVVTHSGFLKRVVKGPKFRNVEYRTYELVEESGELKLIEIDT